jgi:S-adenosylmethionine:tRNA ribosyltransferase-isomerase
LKQRDASKLLLFTDGKINEDLFSNLPDHLPANSCLVFNNSKVIKARLSFAKASGSLIEIFLLEPYPFSGDHYTEMQRSATCTWQCMVGGAAKWKDTALTTSIEVEGKPITITAEKQGRIADDFIIKLSWDSDDVFATILEALGQMPLPPYIKRKAVEEDDTRYQTIYAANQGSVAAPTAGLHFTSEVLQRAQKKNITECYMTLHVGAGTFLPVKAATMNGHNMHGEYFEIGLEQLKILSEAETIIAVGTTSLRMLESLYWLGLKLKKNSDVSFLELGQWEVYQEENILESFSMKEALLHLKEYLINLDKETIVARTSILIVPGYQFKVANYLTTNFHQPKSTLLLLVAAAVGEQWKSIYDFALDNDFRFLSYGDTSLLKTNKNN